jgi:hypothetical protein
VTAAAATLSIGSGVFIAAPVAPPATSVARANFLGPSMPLGMTPTLLIVKHLFLLID